MKNSPIVIVEDDPDDCEILVNVFKEIGVQNEFKCFESPVPALAYLRTTKQVPFIIISDINMPQMNGLAFKRVLNEDKSFTERKVPFVFLSTSDAHHLINEAFHLSVQGYFKKPNDINSLKEIAKNIVEYWKNSRFHHKPM